MGRKCRNPTDLDWDTPLFAHDGRDPRSWPQTKPCRGTACTGAELHCKTNTERGSVVRDVPFVYRTFLVTLLEWTSVSTPSSASVQEALKRMSFF